MLGVAGRFGVGGSVTDAETFGTGADTVGTAGTGGGITLYPGGISNVAAGGCTPVQLQIHVRSPKAPMVRVSTGIRNWMLVQISQLKISPPGGNK